METHRLVLPGDLNHYGSLFGGRLLSWVDEAAWIAASAEFPHCQFVTIGMDKVEFRHGVGDGTILRIHCEKAWKGKTSVTYKVSVTDVKHSPDLSIFETSVTFVSVNDRGQKAEI
ncbi:MAG: acyl-CoA thioesterase [Akkermansiaceae bacterium]|nr:acyl-CoA thioesterase [Akkermansiaceae bacterium]MDP4646298.1 acyl-CoA thioesterase [Akkermansiaceae bacterium]MDP4721468.1 acyl-CoA thioesterase [Akkermansiaceae bacterium]MDP4779861.1 acyl-CoA thioesterase [Akkermansiaceae bacterium]MDP4845828.1 acyl-CoA thioesterase [Akkermansiaceae bacterium]